MSFHVHDHCSRSEARDLEEGKSLPAAKGDGFLHACYPYLYGRGLHPPWKVFGCCILVGLVNISSTFFALAVTTNLGTSDIVLGSNTLLLTTGFLVSLFWRLHASHRQSVEGHCLANDEFFSRAKSCIVGCLFAVMLSPAVASLPLLVVFCFFGSEVFSYDTPGIPLTLSWVLINILATFVVPSFLLGREIPQQGDSIKRSVPPQEGSEGYNTYKNSDETDFPTFLPQQSVPACYDISRGSLGEEIKAAVIFTPAVSWKNTSEPSETLRGLVRWAVSVPAESLQPPLAAEMLTIAAISIGVRLDGMDDWDQDVQHAYIISRTCDRLAEIFGQANQSTVPEHALNVFLFVNRFERFDGVDVKVLGPESGDIPTEELERVVSCLKSRSGASPLGC